ncbi:cysteine-rich KTR domain-containing protein [Enterococcus camelliae]|uniref:Cysteine-rich KTR domain-containing protein n=1 Tax=Enterococcus camelliae TaxID=453959 RepID=A0ABW5TJF4_9ENTE
MIARNVIEIAITEWIQYPVCGDKTRLKIKEDATVSESMRCVILMPHS